VEWIDAAKTVNAFKVRHSGPVLAGNLFDGIELGGWSDHTWVLHSMFEQIDSLDKRTYDEVFGPSAREEMTSGPLGDKIREILDRRDTFLLGTRTGLALNPGDGWRRVRWSELLNRTGDSLTEHQYPPNVDWFPFRSWPVSLVSPCEGSMDVDTLQAVFDVLVRHSGYGTNTRCCLSFARTNGPDFEPRVAQARLWELWKVLAEQYTSGGDVSTPQNMWAIDGSWFTYTSVHLMATKVCGSSAMINELRRNEALETLDWERPMPKIPDTEEWIAYAESSEDLSAIDDGWPRSALASFRKRFRRD